MDSDLDPHYLEYWIRIRIEINADPQHCSPVSFSFFHVLLIICTVYSYSVQPTPAAAVGLIRLWAESVRQGTERSKLVEFTFALVRPPPPTRRLKGECREIFCFRFFS
jgi:hypothetical protein